MEWIAETSTAFDALLLAIHFGRNHRGDAAAHGFAADDRAIASKMVGNLAEGLQQHWRPIRRPARAGLAHHLHIGELEAGDPNTAFREPDRERFHERALAPDASAMREGEDGFRIFGAVEEEFRERHGQDFQ